MSSINTLTISGRLTADPRFDTTPTGKRKVFFTVAQNVWNGKDRDETKLFIEVTGWKDEDKKCFYDDIEKEALVKGQEIGLSGRLNFREYDGKIHLMLEYPVFHGARAYKPAESKPQHQAEVVNDDVPF